MLLQWRPLLSRAVIVLLVLAVIAMIVDFEWLCSTRPAIRQPELGRVYPITCREDRPSTWLNQGEHLQLEFVFGVGIASLAMLGYLLIIRFPDSCS